MPSPFLNGAAGSALDALRAPPPGPGELLANGRAPGDDLRLAAAGDREAFGRLVLKHQDAAFNAAFYYLGDYEDAADAAQDAFLKAYRSLRGFAGACSFRTWILRITLNAARSLRARHRTKKRGAGKVRALGGGGMENAGRAEARWEELPDPDSRSTPTALLERKEVKEALEAAILELDEDSREVIVLRDLSGESYDAIARTLGVPQGTVKSRVHRARLQLRQKMARFL